MWIELSYGITSEIYSSSDYNSRYPHRIAFRTREDIDEWCKKMDEKHGENGWRLGDENVYERAQFPRWPIWGTCPDWTTFQRYAGA